ncbi:amino acid--[acyl-carrier-protein] ligase [Schlesneria paludicola]|uniref:amino acid--[acyl-carrier-protein] ligase n=1 Tax=Schlesneria paludicola TaxID=360056 RepID=UPI00029A1BF3|nr:amino acid--[acyl-carrier-protein] ligase [Schlesneria paludicola]
MCISNDVLTASYQAYLDQLTKAGLLIPLGVKGLYGHSGVFENIIEQFEHLVTQRAKGFKAEVMRFPAILNRQAYLKTNHLETFPDLMGSVHSFTGNERDHVKLLQKRAAGEDWTRDLTPTEVMMTPAACYPLYPTATGTLPAQGRLVDLRSFVFRHEPSIDPCRMQIFRQREFVRLGTPEQALEHRNHWLNLGEEILNSVGLKVERVLANDPFFGRGGRMMAATQKEQDLKYELVIAVASTEKPTAITSCNCHLDHFGHSFEIKTDDGQYAHSSCIGFGLERIALALFKTHGLDPDHWPADIKNLLAL